MKNPYTQKLADPFLAILEADVNVTRDGFESGYFE